MSKKPKPLEIPEDFEIPIYFKNNIQEILFAAEWYSPKIIQISVDSRSIVVVGVTWGRTEFGFSLTTISVGYDINKAEFVAKWIANEILSRINYYKLKEYRKTWLGFYIELEIVLRKAPKIVRDRIKFLARQFFGVEKVGEAYD